MNIEEIAQYYLTTPTYKVPSSIKRRFRQFVIDLAQVELRGLNCQYVDFQPYLKGNEICREEMSRDFSQGKLLISTLFNNSELLGSETNLIFRCIHDVHHIKLNVDFSWQGECASTRHIISLTDNMLFQQILFSEILGQSAVYLTQGYFPESQKVVLFEEGVLDNLKKG